MCGFVGILGRPGAPVDERLLASMAGRISHRGPDEEGSYAVDGVGLYHKRLSIIDLATGRQPMTRGPLTVVFNGEIYNYVELREELRRSGARFETTSDTEVILALYEAHGPAFIDRLNGMFAFLIHDRRRRTVMAARDHFGIKPLYRWEGPEGVLYASEVKALLAHPAVRREPDQDSLRDYLTFQFVIGEGTMFRGVSKLLPGHYEVVDLETLQVRPQRYWEPRFAVDTHHTEAYFVHTLRELLEDTVAIQMRSDVPVGAYLSGGFDSSLVSVLAAARASGTFKTFTGGFREGPEFDETGYAREVARACGAEMFEVYPTEDEFVDLLPRLVYAMDEPVAGPGMFPQYIVSRLAAREVKVVLGGQGGDEIFGGYARYVVAYLEQAIKGAIFQNNEEGEHIVSLTSILPNLPFLRSYVPMMRHFWGSDAFEPMDRRYFRLVNRSQGELEYLTPDFRAAYDPEAVFARFQGLFNHPDTLSYFNKMVHFDMVGNLPALLQVEDRMSMAHSLESRVPLLDRRIVDLVASIPPGMKFRGAEMKYILKRAVRDLLPPVILDRKDKMGFPVPLHIWARNRVREFFHDTLLSERCRSRGLFEPAAVARLIDNENAFGRRLWGLVNLELWHRAFIDAA